MSGSRSLFREKSLEHVSSPEQLDQYLCVSSPRAWIGLVVVVLLLAAALAAAALVSVPETETVAIEVEDGRLSGTADVPDGTYESDVIVGERRLIELVLGL